MIPQLDFEWTIEAFYDKNDLNQTQQETLSTKRRSVTKHEEPLALKESQVAVTQQ